MGLPQNRLFNGTAVVWGDITIPGAWILSLRPSQSVRGIDTSGAFDDEIIQPGQEKDTLTMEVIGPTIVGMATKRIANLGIVRAAGDGRLMPNLCLMKIEENGQKNAPWSTTYQFETADPFAL